VEISNLFKEKYSQEIFDLDSLVKYGYGLGSNEISFAISLAVDTLITFEVYDIDPETFIKHYYVKYHTWDEDFGVINDKYMDIVLNEQQLDEYRTARRQGRRRVIGGGFGIAGATKGMVQAGAINMVFGASQMAFNGLAKLVSMGVNSVKKSSIFYDPSTKQQLVDGINKAILNIHFAIIDVLHDRTSYTISVISDDEMQKAESIFNNILNRDFDELLTKQLIAKYCR
jgi:hypothetical protein